MSIDVTRRAIVAMPAMAAIPGCALLSAPKPVPLFRFGQSAAPGPSAVAEPRVSVLYNGTTFSRPSAGDSILTTTGVGVSYIGGSRWAAPAITLFEEAVLRAFQGSGVRLLNRGTVGRADAVLRIEVRTFEARYTAPESPPTVVVETRALLRPYTTAATTLDEAFDAQLQTSENRVAVVAQAFDSATADVLGRIVAWTQANTRPVTA